MSRNFTTDAHLRAATHAAIDKLLCPTVVTDRRKLAYLVVDKRPTMGQPKEDPPG
jgi:hypothetical protein